jgi:hypothetical protein
VLTLPGRSADLDALAVGLRWEEGRWGHEANVRRDDDAVLVEEVTPPELGERYVERTVFTATPDGDLVAATVHGADPVPLDDLLALARTVAPTDGATWDAFVGEVRGGPGLHADPGRTELMRGMVGDGRGWLLQDQPPGEGGGMSPTDAEGGWSVDPCLVLTGGERACPFTENSREGLWTASGRAEDGLAYTVVATTWPEVDGLFVTTDGETDIVEMAPVPGTDELAAVVVGEGFVFDPCPDPRAPVPGPRRIELTTAEVAPVTCPP